VIDIFSSFAKNLSRVRTAFVEAHWYDSQTIPLHRKGKATTRSIAFPRRIQNPIATIYHFDDDELKSRASAAWCLTG
jgi:hypothetical protein